MGTDVDEDERMSFKIAKLHYEKLMNAFKFMMSLVSILIALGLFFLYRSYGEIDARIQKVADDAAVQVKAIELENAQALAKLNSTYREELESILKDSEKEVVSTSLNLMQNELSRPYIQGYIKENIEREIIEDLDILAYRSFNDAAEELKSLSIRTSRIQSLHARGVWNDLAAIRMIDSLRVEGDSYVIRAIADEALQDLADRHRLYGVRDVNPTSHFRNEAVEPYKSLTDAQLIEMAIAVINQKSYRGEDYTYADIQNVYRFFQILDDLISEKIIPFHYRDIDRLEIRKKYVSKVE